ncbi:MAG: arginine biosynthesis bifunctional protein ArgJ, partial [Vulcanococcus sp.]
MTYAWRLIDGGVTAPAGFQASGITAGLKASGKPDLSLVLAPE